MPVNENIWQLSQLPLILRYVLDTKKFLLANKIQTPTYNPSIRNSAGISTQHQN